MTLSECRLVNISTRIERRRDPNRDTSLLTGWMVMYGAAMIADSLMESANRSKVAPQGEVMDSTAPLGDNSLKMCPETPYRRPVFVITKPTLTKIKMLLKPSCRNDDCFDFGLSFDNC